VLVTALLVKNEADKYLERVLRRCLEFSDKVIVLDDGSTDGSDRIAWRLGCEVKPWTGETMWGTESPARAALWDWGAREAGDGWLLICDADMELVGDPRPLTLSRQHTAWAWVLYDMWTPKEYRKDGYWQGHTVPRTWMFKPSAMGNEAPIWPDRGLHTGHAPCNFPYDTGILDNHQYYWVHLGYATPELREAKYQQYLSKQDQLSAFELAHASSIMDHEWSNSRQSPMRPSIS
jgi:hypothetical protein